MPGLGPIKPLYFSPAPAYDVFIISSRIDFWKLQERSYLGVILSEIGTSAKVI